MASAQLFRTLAGVLALLATACSDVRGPLFGRREGSADAGSDALLAPTSDAAVLTPNASALLRYGGRAFSGTADLQWLAGNAATLATTPFDGMVVDLGLPPLFSTNVLDMTALGAAADAFAPVAKTRMRLNFQRMQVSSTNWSNDAAFATISANLKAVALLVKRAGMRGIFLDTQNYGARVWGQPPGVTADQMNNLEALVKARGRQVGEALATNFGGMEVLVTVGPGEVFRAVCLAGEPWATTRYALLPAFLAGLAQAHANQPSALQVTDAFLPAYPAQQPAAFAMYRHAIHGQWDKLVEAWVPGVASYTFPEMGGAWTGQWPWPPQPALLCKDSDRMRVTPALSVGFGLMLDYGSDEPLSRTPETFFNNYHQPAGFANVLAAALRQTDRYVWLWTTSVDFIAAPNAPPAVPEAYLQAVFDARAAAGL